ncbi:MAG TPA: hypothetical protein VMW24_21035 [Sedimentisphaerales bacterium]|nr:hypothetical protein [Sedimentisphaerales bacterium]
MYHHACGQPVTLQEHHNGYLSWYLTLVDGEAVRECPRCGKRIWVETLIYRDDALDTSWLADYLDYQQMVRDLGPVLA